MKKFWKKVLASSLAFICTVTAGVAAVATNGFGLFNAAQVEGVEHNKQLSFGNFFGNGIMLTASAAESTAVTLTHGNDYNTAWVDSLKRACIQPYGIEIPSGVTLTAKSGYQFGFYRVTDISAPTSATMLSSNWVDTYTTTSNGTYGISLKKVDDSDFNFSTDSIYIADYIDSTDSSIFGSSGSTPSTPSKEPVYTGGSRYTLKATVNDDATDKRVTWSIAWKDSNASWAKGKTVTDYVTLSPASEYALNAEICLEKKFGEQIIVTVQSVDNPELFANCTIDCVKDIESLSFMCTNIINVLNGRESKTFTSQYYDVKDSITITDISFYQPFSVYPLDIVYGDGTMDLDIQGIEFYFSVNEESLSTLNSVTGNNYTYTIGLNGSKNGCDLWAQMITASNYEGRCEAFGDLISCNGNNLTAPSNVERTRAVMTYLHDNPTFSLFNLKVTIWDSFGVHSEYNSKIYFDPDIFVIPAEELALNESGVVFA